MTATEEFKGTKPISVSFRSFTAADVDEVVKIEQESFSDPWNKNMFLSLLLEKSTITDVAAAEGQIVGYMSIIATKYVCEVLNIAVKKDFRRQKIAQSFLSRAVMYAKNAGADKIFLEARAGNVAALSLYSKFGFNKDGVRKKYYPDGEDAVLMSFDIKED